MCNTFPDVLNELNLLITDSIIFQNKRIHKILLIFNNDETHEIIIDESRKFYSDEINNITIIEIKEEDNFSLNSFFKIGYLYVNRPHNFYEDKSFYTIYFPDNKKAEYSIGKIQNFNNNKFENSPIIDLNTHILFDINKQNDKKINFGIFKNSIINFFKEERNKINKRNNIQKKIEIIILMK